MPMAFTYVAIGWIIAILAITTGAGLWQLRKWGYRIGLLFGVVEILMASLNILFAFSGYWEQFMLDQFDVTLADLGYTYGSLLSESILTGLPYFLLSCLFLIALWKMKPTFNPSGMLLNYLKLYNHINISELALKSGLTQVDVELLAQDLVAKGEPIEIDLNTRELTFKAPPLPPPQPSSHPVAYSRFTQSKQNFTKQHICSKCRSPLVNNIDFCPQCGAAVDNFTI